MGVILNPDDLWKLASPPALLFGDAANGIQGIEPGKIGALLRSGSGSGSIDVSGIPRDAWPLVLRCAVGGEINVNEVANPGPLPVFELSRDNGTHFGTQIRVSDNRNEAYITAGSVGLRFAFRNGSPAPSFVAGTSWSFSTEPSPDILELIPCVESEILESAAGSYDLPLLAVPQHWRFHGARLLRWYLLTKIGVSKRRDMMVYYPKDTYAWMEKQADGRGAVKGKSQGVIETPPGTSFPLLVPPLPDKLIPPI